MTVGITFQTDKKIPVKFSELIFNREINKKHYSRTIRGNPHILMKCSLIDICDIILFQKKSNFPVAARDLIFLFY